MNTEKTLNTRSKIAREIVDYLSRNPDSEGTIESIAEWWLLDQRILEAVESVQSAITELLSENILIERRTGNECVSYRINRDRLHDTSLKTRE